MDTHTTCPDCPWSKTGTVSALTNALLNHLSSKHGRVIAAATIRQHVLASAPSRKDTNMTTTPTHYTAWLSTSPSVLEGDTIDLTVLEDEIHGYEFDANGNEDENRPIWTSTSTEAFYTDLGIRHDDEDTDVQAAAEAALRDAGWSLDSGWEANDTGYTIVVSK